MFVEYNVVMRTGVPLFSLPLCNGFHRTKTYMYLIRYGQYIFLTNTYEYLHLRVYLVSQYTHTYLDVHWLQTSIQSRFLFIFCHFLVCMFKPGWVCPGISVLFPGVSPTKTRIFLVQSAQRVQNAKLTTATRKWPFPWFTGPSQEIRPQQKSCKRSRFEDIGIYIDR